MDTATAGRRWRTVEAAGQDLPPAPAGGQGHRPAARSQALAGQLQESLSSRVRTEQAKGMLAERRHVAADDAFVALRQYARRHRMPLDQIARAVLDRSADDAELRG